MTRPRIVTMKRLILAAVLPGALVAPAQAPAKTTWRYCGNTPAGLAVLANQNTSCPFARTVGQAADKSGFRKRLYVWSDAADRFLWMRRTGCGCRSSSPFTYKGGHRAAVRIAS